jgi:hypothetical protein
MSDREVFKYKKMSTEEKVLFQNDKIEEANRILAIIVEHEDPRAFTQWLYKKKKYVDYDLPNSGSVEVYNPRRMEILKVLEDLFLDVNSFSRKVVSDYELSIIVRLKEIYDNRHS